VLAFCFEYEEGIAFSNGLSEPDEPSIAIRDLTGLLRVWIDVGAPEAARLHRAAKAAPRVVVYTHKDPRLLAERLGGERIHRVEALEVYALDPAWLAALSARLQRRMTFSLTIAEQHVYLSLGDDTFPCVIEESPSRVDCASRLARVGRAFSERTMRQSFRQKVPWAQEVFVQPGFWRSRSGRQS